MMTMKSGSTFACYPINVAQLVTTATVALVGAVDIGALLAAWVGVALVDICQHAGTDATRVFTSLRSFRYLIGIHHVIYFI